MQGEHGFFALQGHFARCDKAKKPPIAKIVKGLPLKARIFIGIVLSRGSEVFDP
jgi:hypothetical protein